MRWEKGLPKGLPPGAPLPFCPEVERGGRAHVPVPPPPGPRKEEATFASHQPTADPWPSNTCSPFLTGPGGTVARRERRKGGKAGGCSEGICVALTAPPPGHLVPQPLPERSGMQAAEEEARGHCVVSTPPTVGKCRSPRLAGGGGEAGWTKHLDLVSEKSRPWNRRAKAMITFTVFFEGLISDSDKSEAGGKGWAAWTGKAGDGAAPPPLLPMGQRVGLPGAGWVR